MNLKRKHRSLIAAGLAGMVLFGVTGCEQVFVSRGDVEISRDENRLLVLFCEDFLLTRIDVSTSDHAPFGFNDSIIDAVGELDVVEGKIIQTGSEEDGLDYSTFLEPDFGSLDEIQVFAMSDEADTWHVAAFFSPGDEGVPTDAWLKPDGTLSSQPCA